ncbi:MAG: DJ-1/PfpI family protein [Elusimicrobia bacterium]|nr:DJ-1/PfpI family protein [Elusimicrobiota bacterium]
MKKVVMIIAKEKFRDEEYFHPRDVFLKAKIDVVTASSSGGTANGAMGGTANIDITIDDIDIIDYDAVVFIGGKGSAEYFEDKKAHQIAQEAVKHNKILAAICSSSLTLAIAGVLKSKNATVFQGDADEFKKHGVIYTGKDVEVDGKIVTASGPHAAKRFGEKILELLAQEK